jgi:hypothetical protein
MACVRITGSELRQAPTCSRDGLAGIQHSNPGHAAETDLPKRGEYMASSHALLSERSVAGLLLNFTGVQILCGNGPGPVGHPYVEGHLC